MSKYRTYIKNLNKSTLVLSLFTIVTVASVVYAAVSISATGGGATTQFTTNWGDCRNIQNNNGLALFVPANTQAEWDAFISNAPNKNLSSCCTANSGQSCTSSANACGQTNTGTYDCAGVCSASTPSNPAGYGNACTSAANACGVTSSGTIQCDGSCSATTPANPAGYGDPCTSAPNSCGQTNSGTIGCSGSCSATTPSDASCPAPSCSWTEDYPPSYGQSACGGYTGGGATPGDNGGNFSPDFHFGTCDTSRNGEAQLYSGCWAPGVEGTGEYHCTCI